MALTAGLCRATLRCHRNLGSAARQHSTDGTTIIKARACRLTYTQLPSLPGSIAYQRHRQRPPSYLPIRKFSSSSCLRDEKIPLETEELPPALQASYDRLRPIVDSFEAPIDWAVAYGSGVMKQAQAKPGEPKPMTDLLFSTPSSEAFHAQNLRQNPSHYPIYARVLGPSFVASVQEKWGAGVWYVTMVEVDGLSIKYGVISSDALVKDLEGWTTFYISGRLHKPTLPLHSSDSTIRSAIQTNLRAGLSTSLLLLPGSFSEDDLWEKIAGLSYSGDPRMNVPGAENPMKVKNIVRGQGAREGFRRMYQPFFHECGVEFENGVERWSGKDGETRLVQIGGSNRRARLAATLPLTLRKSLEIRLQLTRPTATAGNNEKTGDDLWIMAMQDARFTAILSEELRKIIGPPALRQSIKGLFTAGPVKSFWYSLEKVKKWYKGRGTRDE